MTSKSWAILFTVLYGLGVAIVMLFGRVSIESRVWEEAEILVEFLEPEPEPEVITPPENPVVAPKHYAESIVENTEQVAGADEQTRTVNQRALFKMSKGGNDATENAGNPHAKQDEKEQSTGRGAGLNPVGTEALDEGLQGRGLVGALPTPVYPAGNRGGKVVVRVSVDREGKVTSATYEPKGSTTSDSALVEAAIKAARQARFTESAAFIQGGTITYIFKLSK